MSGKRFFLILCTMLIVSSVGSGGWSTPGVSLAHERDVVDVSVFYDALAPYGTWTTVHEHGLVWIPRGVPPGWRPYTHGRWVYTDVGWTWVSDWEWGWAPFHYGRWAYSDYSGWYWVPGTVWGPAWVSWRRTPGWVGWAPLPPSVGFHVGIGLGAGHIGVDIAPSWFSFVEERHVLTPRVRHHIAPPARNVQLVHVTQNVTNYTVINNRIVNNSIEVKNIEKVTKRPVVVHRIVDTDSDKEHGPRVRDKEREVVLTRPAAVRERSERQAQDQPRQRNDDRPGVSETRTGRDDPSLQQRANKSEDDERAARQERRRERPPQAEEAARIEPGQQQGAERAAREDNARRRHQELPRRQQQAPPELPHSQQTENLERRGQPEQQPPTQKRSDPRRRPLPSAKQEQMPTLQGQSPVQPGPVTPAERRARREAMQQSGPEDGQKRPNKKGRKPSTPEEQTTQMPGSPSN